MANRVYRLEDDWIAFETNQAGLTSALSGALARSRWQPEHDRCRVLVDLAVPIADGGEAIADIDVLRHQDEVFGPVASDTTMWRALDEIGAVQLARISVARAKVRRLAGEVIVPVSHLVERGRPAIRNEIGPSDACPDSVSPPRWGGIAQCVRRPRRVRAAGRRLRYEFRAAGAPGDQGLQGLDQFGTAR